MEKVKSKERHNGHEIIWYQRRGRFQAYDVRDSRGLMACGFFNPDLESEARILESLKEKDLW